MTLNRLSLTLLAALALAAPLAAVNGGAKVYSFRR